MDASRFQLLQMEMFFYHWLLTRKFLRGSYEVPAKFQPDLQASVCWPRIFFDTYVSVESEFLILEKHFENICTRPGKQLPFRACLLSVWGCCGEEHMRTGTLKSIFFGEHLVMFVERISFNEMNRWVGPTKLPEIILAVVRSSFALSCSAPNCSALSCSKSNCSPFVSHNCDATNHRESHNRLRKLPHHATASSIRPHSLHLDSHIRRPSFESFWISLNKSFLNFKIRNQNASVTV